MINKKAILKTTTTMAVAALVAMPTMAPAQDSMPGEGVSIDMARASWDTGWWQAEIYSQMLQELGYEVSRITTLDNPPFYQTVAQGDVDLWVNGWFPLHNSYEDAFENGAEKIGYVAKGGALQGYLIDKKTAEEHDITHVSDITKDDIQELFDADGDGKADLVACPPGWGCETVISHHFEAYDWGDDFNAIKAGYSASMADALGRYQNGEPIFFYTWTPNWTVGELVPGEDVVWLQMKETKLPEDQADLADATTVESLEGCRGEQPCDLGWPANDIRPVANSDFLEENPAAAELLRQARIPISAIFDQNAMMNDGADSPEDLEEQAAAWIENNRDTVDGWLDAAREAASM
ncbi:MAG: glycine betaine/L-proline ABC transporter substrate-binding protein ProX [Pseudomonadota bacterium]|uniref:glycine betaine/L-proline ABC transporter substrate-binding protein ProX n=1 Tax=Roseovarius TaxID=74030 RepID=UPI0022A766F2|nr:glycine betaine/L-proline ABC transporter substrate-binding protein ProX [Roseovarius sp. EGI FJ00037]MCZ0811656.1 glycine betaine/L-proline ABC transporter substrate-binding protein ProX [Roseovarius sp. EGI FJ00037]